MLGLSNKLLGNNVIFRFMWILYLIIANLQRFAVVVVKGSVLCVICQVKEFGGDLNKLRAEILFCSLRDNFVHRFTIVEVYPHLNALSLDVK